MKNMKKIERLKKEMNEAEETWEKVNELPSISVNEYHVFDNKKLKEIYWRKYIQAEEAYYKELNKKTKKEYKT